jgi:hypothetical protein
MSISTGLTGTGSSQGTSYPISTKYSVFSTVALNAGALLPVNMDDVYIRNTGANGLLIWPPVGYSVDGGSVNASVSISANTTARYVKDAAGNWFRMDK